MGILVNEAMELGALMKCEVVAGKEGLDRIIDQIIVMEIPDVVEWLNGNDLVLTSLFPIKDDMEAISQLIPKLHASGSAALAVKNRYFDEFPAAIIREANRLNFPVIEIKHEIAFLDIITPLMKELLSEGTTNQKNTEEFFKWITELALGGKGLPTLIQAVESFLGNPVSIESEMPYVNSVQKEEIKRLSVSQVRELIQSKRPVKIKRVRKNKTVSSIVAPILLNKTAYGFITCWETNRPFAQIDLTVVERIVPLFALEFLKIKTRLDVEQEYKNDFLYEILLGHISDEKALIEKAKLFHWDLTVGYKVIVIDLENFNSVFEKSKFDEVTIKEFKNKILNKLKMILIKEAIISHSSDKFVILFPMNSKEYLTPFIRSLEILLQEGIEQVNLTVGIGNFYPGISGIHQGYEEALKAIKISGILGWSGKIINFNDLGIYKLFTHIKGSKELELFYQETVGKLVDYDKENNTELVESLREYFNKNYSLVETAQSLFIHVNTLKYRLEKIDSITTLSINRAEDRLRLHIGLKIMDIL
jgi:PucR family transcriptional regulator, purine catabolism regulatory protein